MSYRTTVAMIKIGLVGPHAEGWQTESTGRRNACSMSGWRDDPATWASDTKEIPDGTPVVDASELLDRDPYLAIRSPMCDPLLDADQVNACPDLTVGIGPMLAASGWGGLMSTHERAKRTEPREPGPLDSISVAAYVRWWRVRGARIGVYRGGRVEYPPVAERAPEPTQGGLL